MPVDSLLNGFCLIFPVHSATLHKSLCPLLKSCKPVPCLLYLFPLWCCLVWLQSNRCNAELRHNWQGTGRAEDLTWKQMCNCFYLLCCQTRRKYRVAYVSGNIFYFFWYTLCCCIWFWYLRNQLPLACWGVVQKILGCTLQRSWLVSWVGFSWLEAPLQDSAMLVLYRETGGLQLSCGGLWLS